jgi:hypothetical protein
VIYTLRDHFFLSIRNKIIYWAYISAPIIDVSMWVVRKSEWSNHSGSVRMSESFFNTPVAKECRNMFTNP